ncbi:hypothetical protein AMTR_s00130p00092880 [Amborella trichopoda]|uniref:Uncharacterized protein n=1 Tax=Amborella trichopoda TaxID=13333 RepID=W1NPF8_AMBTC|nr:hypothetical protein AMTR_s00130p00092880 [Amborella trichopoda]
MKTVLSTEGVEQEKAMTEIKEALKTLEGGLKGRFFSGEFEEFTSIDLLKESFPPYNKLIASDKARREDHLAAKFFPN